MGTEWVTEINVPWKENEILDAMNRDIDVLCPHHWRGTFVVLLTVEPQPKNLPIMGRK